MFWILILCLLGLSITAAFRGMSLLNWTLGMALVLVGFAVFTDVSMLAITILAVLFAAVAIPLNYKPMIGYIVVIINFTFAGKFNIV